MDRRTGRVYGRRNRSRRRTASTRRRRHYGFRRPVSRYGGRRRVRASTLPWRWIGVGAVVVAALITGVAVFGSSPAAEATTPDVLVVATGSSNERKPALPEEARQQLHSLALTGVDPNVMVLSVDGNGTTRSRTIDLTPRRNRGNEEHSEKRRRDAADQNVDAVDAAVGDTVSTVPGHALLAGLQEAGRSSAHNLVVVSSGIDTNDPFDLRKTGFDYSSTDLVGFLKKENALPKLTGKKVLLALSPTAGTQAPLDEPSTRNVERLWTAVIKASGATVRTAQSGSQEPPKPTFATPAVAVPKITSPTPTPTPTPGGGEDKTFILPSNLLFTANEATLLDPKSAQAQLHTVLDNIDDRTTISIVGHTAHVANPRDDGRLLSRRRAEVIRDLLVNLHVPATAITRIQGVGETEPIVQPPEDPQNRAVVVVLTNRP